MSATTNIARSIGPTHFQSKGLPDIARTHHVGKRALPGSDSVLTNKARSERGVFAKGLNALAELMSTSAYARNAGAGKEIEITQVITTYVGSRGQSVYLRNADLTVIVNPGNPNDTYVFPKNTSISGQLVNHSMVVEMDFD